MIWLRILLGIPTRKRIVCLANSRKYGGRCIAGKEWPPSGAAAEASTWIRPVSRTATEELSLADRQYRDGTEPELLDILDIGLQRHRPRAFQTENWRVAPHPRFTRRGSLAWKDLAAIADDPPTLWLNDSSSNRGLNNRVTVPEAQELRTSLYLIQLPRLSLIVSSPGGVDGQRRVQASFLHHDQPYRVAVTDPLVEQSYSGKKDGEYAVGPAFATISLGEPFDGHCYKLLAALMLASKETE